MPVYSIVDGKVLDWRWEKHAAIENHYLFYVGDVFIGQIWGGKLGWSALHRKSQTIGLVSGFRTRYDALHFLLKFETDIKY